MPQTWIQLQTAGVHSWVRSVKVLLKTLRSNGFKSNCFWTSLKFLLVSIGLISLTKVCFLCFVVKCCSRMKQLFVLKLITFKHWLCLFIESLYKWCLYFKPSRAFLSVPFLLHFSFTSSSSPDELWPKSHKRRLCESFSIDSMWTCEKHWAVVHFRSEELLWSVFLLLSLWYHTVFKSTRVTLRLTNSWKISSNWRELVQVEKLVKVWNSSGRVHTVFHQKTLPNSFSVFSWNTGRIGLFLLNVSLILTLMLMFKELLWEWKSWRWCNNNNNNDQNHVSDSWCHW